MVFPWLTPRHLESHRHSYLRERREKTTKIGRKEPKAVEITAPLPRTLPFTLLEDLYSWRIRVTISKSESLRLALDRHCVIDVG